MDLTPHVDSLAERLSAAAPEDSAMAIQRVLASLEPAMQLQIMDVLSVAALELSEAMPHGHVELRLAGHDVQLVYVEDEPASEPTATDDDGAAARITLRLPEGLKTAVEAAADTAGVSTNTWLVQAVRQAIDGRPSRRANTGRSFSGFAIS